MITSRQLFNQFKIRIKRQTANIEGYNSMKEVAKQYDYILSKRHLRKIIKLIDKEIIRLKNQ